MSYICYLSIYRKQKGINQKDLANALNISRKTLSNIENGFLPNLELAFKISEMLKISIYELWKKSN